MLVVIQVKNAKILVSVEMSFVEIRINTIITLIIFKHAIKNVDRSQQLKKIKMRYFSDEMYKYVKTITADKIVASCIKL